MVDRLEIVTSLGPVRLTGHVRGKRPLVLAITGAFADHKEMSRMPELMEPHFDGAVSHLPGNQTPTLRETGVEAFAQAYDEALAFLNRPTVVVGISIGALVAMAMKVPKGLFLVDPPLDTGKLWPLNDVLRSALAEHRTFVQTVFGLTETGIEPRRYHHLAEKLSTPAIVLWGSEPLLPIRPLQRLPSLCADEDRACLERNPVVRSVVAPNSGHNVPVQAGRLMVDLVNRQCTEVLLPT